MRIRLQTRCLILAAGLAVVAAAADAPRFNDAGELLFPADYRDWVYLSTGLGMTYGPAAPARQDDPRFDTVFVKREAWQAFQSSGQWPEGTVFVLEIRKSASEGSINRGGHFQAGIAAVEVSVKDTKRFARTGGWAYFDFGGGDGPVRASATALDVKRGCNACHSANGAVDNTFVQFYPTALDVATRLGTIKKPLTSR